MGIAFDAVKALQFGTFGAIPCPGLAHGLRTAEELARAHRILAVDLVDEAADGGLLAEFGVVLPQTFNLLRRALECNVLASTGPSEASQSRERHFAWRSTS